jgi:RNA polymerase sigma-70 factor (ECF subfamily)
LPWLLSVARKTLANDHRRARRRQSLLAELKTAETARAAPAGADLALADVVAALERLAQGDQELLKLVAWEGLDLGAAATVLGISGPTCRVRLHRARKRLGRELARDVPEPRRQRVPPITKEARP